jgi:hypothetical protein
MKTFWETAVLGLLIGLYGRNTFTPPSTTSPTTANCNSWHADKASAPLSVAVASEPTPEPTLNPEVLKAEQETCESFQKFMHFVNAKRAFGMTLLDQLDAVDKTQNGPTVDFSDGFRSLWNNPANTVKEYITAIYAGRWPSCKNGEVKSNIGFFLGQDDEECLAQAEVAKSAGEARDRGGSYEDTFKYFSNLISYNCTWNFRVCQQKYIRQMEAVGFAFTKSEMSPDELSSKVYNICLDRIVEAWAEPRSDGSPPARKFAGGAPASFREAR